MSSTNFHAVKFLLKFAYGVRPACQQAGLAGLTMFIVVFIGYLW